MKPYHKIPTVYKRDPATNHKTLLVGDYALPEFEYLQSNKWIFTEKVDGTNIRVMWDGERVTFGGKTDNAMIPAFLVDKLQQHFPDASKFSAQFDEPPVCLYGEGYGAKIQKGGGKYRPDQEFVLFDVRVGDWWLLRDDVVAISTKMHLEVMPIIGRGDLIKMVDMAQVGVPSRWGNFTAEGIVARPEIELQRRNGDRIITKIKYKDFGGCK